MSAGVQGPLTVVTAPAGSGKSVLLASWSAAGRPPGPTVWITLDPGDEQPGTFWSYVLAGLDRAGRPVPGADVPARADSVDDSFLIRLAAHLYSQPEPVVLVLDEADVLAAPSAVTDGLDFLLRHARPKLRLVLAGRVEPALPLHRHRLAGSIAEIRLDDLAFTPAEATELLAAHDVTMPGSSLATLVERTRGWPASLRIVALSLQHTPRSQMERVAAGLAGDRGPLADYFASEVLRSQPPELQLFLLRTSVADHLPPGLAEELTGRPDAARMLEAQARADALIDGCAEHADCYRYHPLYAEMLRALLARESPGDVAPLHRAAARWLLDAGRPAEAVRQFSAAGDRTEVAALVVGRLGVGELLAGTDGGELSALLAEAPDETGTAELAVLRAVLAARRHDQDGCRRALTRAAELLPEIAPGDLPAVTLTGSLAAAVSARLAGDSAEVLRSVAAAEEAVEALLCAGRSVPAEVRWAIGYEQGVGLLWDGRLEPAAAALAAAAQLAHRAGLEAARMQALGQLALAETLAGRLTRAAAAGAAAEAIGDALALPGDRRSAAAAAALAWVRSEECDASGARTQCDRTAARATLAGDAVAGTVLTLVRARLLRARGGPVAGFGPEDPTGPAPAAVRIPAWLEFRVAAEAAAYEVTRGRVGEARELLAAAGQSDLPCMALAVASTELGEGRLEAARSSLAPVLEMTGLPLDVRTSAWLLRASLELESGEPVAARASLEKALRIAEPERLRRPVLDATPQLRGYLRRHRELAVAHSWLLGAGPRTGPAPGAARTRPAGGTAVAAPVVLLPLTEKEQEVLGHLSALLSTEEIAHAMFVSVNTVKTHVRAILRKLEVSGRNEAIRRARDLQLI